MLQSPILELRPSTNRIESAKERDNILESKARELLNSRGISLDDDEDISRAADLILYGKRRDQVNYAIRALNRVTSKTWKDFLDELRKLSGPFSLYR
jgi:hypothetical protein